MDLQYASNDLERTCTDSRQMQKRLGAAVAKMLQRRIKELEYAQEMDDLLHGTGRWEQLQADRAGQWSARLTGNWRLIVVPVEENVTVLVLEVVDYHRK